MYLRVRFWVQSVKPMHTLLCKNTMQQDVMDVCTLHTSVKPGSQYDAGRCVASRHASLKRCETQRDAGIEPNSIPMYVDCFVFYFWQFSGYANRMTPPPPPPPLPPSRSLSLPFPSLPPLSLVSLVCSHSVSQLGVVLWTPLSQAYHRA